MNDAKNYAAAGDLRLIAAAPRIIVFVDATAISCRRGEIASPGMTLDSEIIFNLCGEYMTIR